MAKKISSLLFAVALMAAAFLHAYEARHVVNLGEAFEKDLQKAEAMIKNTNVGKSEVMLKELGNAYKKDMDSSRPYEKKLKNFSRAVAQKRAPLKKEKPAVSIIDSILKDFGLNGGKKDTKP